MDFFSLLFIMNNNIVLKTIFGHHHKSITFHLELLKSKILLKSTQLIILPLKARKKIPFEMNF